MIRVAAMVLGGDRKTGRSYERLMKEYGYLKTIFGRIKQYNKRNKKLKKADVFY